MNAKTFQPGQFNKKLLLQEKLETPDGCGGFVSSWSDIGEIWGHVVPIDSERALYANNSSQEITHKIHIRQNSQVRSGNQFILDGRSLLLTSVYDPDETGRYLQCNAREQEE